MMQLSESEPELRLIIIINVKAKRLAVIQAARFL